MSGQFPTEPDRRVVAEAAADLERLKRLLGTAIRMLSAETLAAFLSETEGTLRSRDPSLDVVERFRANAVLVGVLTCMFEGMRQAGAAPEERAR